jgi:hypothetical protein
MAAVLTIVPPVMVVGKIAVTTPELARLVTVAPATVKKLAVTPVKVYPVAGESIMVAV